MVIIHKIEENNPLFLQRVLISSGGGAENVSVSNVIGWVSVMFAQWSAARPMAVSVLPYMASPASGAPREAKWTRI